MAEQIKYAEIILSGAVDETISINCIGNNTYKAVVESKRFVRSVYGGESFMTYADATEWCEQYIRGEPNVMVGIAEVRRFAPTTVKEIAAAAGMSCRKLAERFGIPYRTMEDWSSGKRVPPDYLLAMMCEILSV